MDSSEYIKNAIYTAQNQHKLVLSGHQDYEHAREMILKFMNFGLPKGQLHDLKEYFKSEVAGSGDIMSNVSLMKQSQKEAWEALEYFDLI